jgi:hypothetical protein
MPMDKILNFQNKIKKVLQGYVDDVNRSNSELETFLISDDVSSNYLLCQNQWRDMRRIYGCFLHIRIKNGKIYVEYDGTDIGFADWLVAEGIQKDEIVLAFHAEAKRPHTGFAVM